MRGSLSGLSVPITNCESSRTISSTLIFTLPKRCVAGFFWRWLCRRNVDCKAANVHLATWVGLKNNPSSDARKWKCPTAISGLLSAEIR